MRMKKSHSMLEPVSARSGPISTRPLSGPARRPKRSVRRRTGSIRSLPHVSGSRSTTSGSAPPCSTRAAPATARHGRRWQPSAIAERDTGPSRAAIATWRRSGIPTWVRVRWSSQGRYSASPTASNCSPASLRCMPRGDACCSWSYVEPCCTRQSPFLHRRRTFVSCQRRRINGRTSCSSWRMTRATPTWEASAAKSRRRTSMPWRPLGSASRSSRPAPPVRRPARCC